MKCRFCTSDEELHFKQPYHKGDRPIRTLDGRDHICSNNKPQENTGTSIKEIYDRNKWYCSFHKVEVEGIICHICGEFRSVVRGSELNK